MRNRVVGILTIGIAILMGSIIFLFNRGLTDIVNTSCTHGPICPMWGTITFQTNTSLAIMVFVILIGLYLIFFGEEKKIITKIKTLRPQFEAKKITKENYKSVIKSLSAEEKNIFEKIIEAQGTIFQSDLAEKTNFSKVKVTRILDRLEGRGLIERRRRGMTNSIILKK